ncbi:hypothetical protein QA644_30920 (plasmid) [Rhizobium sp. CC1099]|uniref:hypothetical protein n=1 Tax=Rhizobium sp. CC1099 TaxID=3039160 RepID=UPI0024B23E39|nr:hypothetical protein [Rhizobium sp. CC1099]WFU90396.1 hypothetical protein QA644_30920 [Rhizobium sp. CC1099]
MNLQAWQNAVVRCFEKRTDGRAAEGYRRQVTRGPGRSVEILVLAVAFPERLTHDAASKQTAL